MRRALLVLLALITLSCGGKSGARDPVIKERLQEWGLEAFPEDDDVVWHHRETGHKGDFSVVEAEPAPNRTGYARARLIIHWKPEGPSLIACLVRDDKHWTQMFEDTDAPEGWREKAGLD